MKKTILPLLMVLTALLTGGCGPVENEFTDKDCFFYFQGTYHPTSSIITACTGSNLFAKVTKSPLDGSVVRYRLNVELSDGQTSHDDIVNDVETHYRCLLGFLGRGLVIGCSSLNPGETYAFDVLCPQCYSDYGREAVTNFANNGTELQCPSCKRSYNLLYGGTSADGGKLFRYRSNFISPTLRVSTK